MVANKGRDWDLPIKPLFILSLKKPYFSSFMEEMLNFLLLWAFLFSSQLSTQNMVLPFSRNWTWFENLLGKYSANTVYSKETLWWILHPVTIDVSQKGVLLEQPFKLCCTYQGPYRVYEIIDTNVKIKSESKLDGETRVVSLKKVSLYRDLYSKRNLTSFKILYLYCCNICF